MRKTVLEIYVEADLLHDVGNHFIFFATAVRELVDPQRPGDDLAHTHLGFSEA